MEENLKRLNKFIGETGFCSRREADKLIENGRVTLNGVVPEMGTKVSPSDEVRIDGKLIRDNNEKLIYLAFNKPVGIECTTNLDVPENIVDYINYPKRIFPIGRLDKASEGLIFMTNDGDIVNKILRARNNHEKEYTVTVDKPITGRFIEKMGNGVPILDTVTRKCKVEQVSKYVFKIILTQGLNRQIRRMCEYLGYEVTALKRIRIINISLDLPVGRYRELTDAEILELNQLIEPSSKTEEASLPKVEKEERHKRHELKVRNEERVKSQEPRLKNDEKVKTQKPGIESKPQRKIAILPRETQSDEKKPILIKREPKTENPEANLPKTSPLEEPKPPSRWKVDFIPKDDPDYKKRGEY